VEGFLSTRFFIFGDQVIGSIHRKSNRVRIRPGAFLATFKEDKPQSTAEFSRSFWKGRMSTSKSVITDEKRLRQTLLIGLILAAVTLTLYWPVQSYDFVNFDDDVLVQGNRHISGGLSREGFTWAFTTFHTGNWHPLT
jgi:hypothetical protein